MRRCGGVAAAWLLASVAGATVALGPARLARGDVSVLSVGATCVTALLLTGLGSLWWRAVNRWPCRLALLVIALPLLVITAMPVGIAVWATHPSHAAEAHDRPADAIDIAIPCTRGAVLAAWYLPTRDGAAVVLAHGAGSTRGTTLSQAAVLNDAGYGVLMVDARGHGASSGEAMDLGWWGDEDLGCALDALSGIEGVDAERLGVVGLSMGGEQAIGVAANDARVRAVVAEGATQRTSADKAGWLPGGPGGWVQRRMDAERDAIVSVLTDAPRPASLRHAAQASSAPILLVVAGTVADESRAAAWMGEGNSRVEALTIDGSPHTGGLSTAPDVWADAVIGFLDGALA